MNKNFIKILIVREVIIQTFGQKNKIHKKININLYLMNNKIVRTKNSEPSRKKNFSQ